MEELGCRRLALAHTPGVVMLSYRVEDGIVVITALGSSTLEQRREVFEAIRDDPSVGQPALVLFDGRRMAEDLDEAAVRQRLKVLQETLGAKLGPAYAVLPPPSHVSEPVMFRQAGA